MGLTIWQNYKTALLYDSGALRRGELSRTEFSRFRGYLLSFGTEIMRRIDSDPSLSPFSHYLYQRMAWMYFPCVPQLWSHGNGAQKLAQHSYFFALVYWLRTSQYVCIRFIVLKTWCNEKKGGRNAFRLVLTGPDESWVLNARACSCLDPIHNIVSL